MPTGLRVRLTPLRTRDVPESRHVADGARISFELLGAPSADVKPDATFAATLKLEMELIERVRGEGAREKSVLAELGGKLELRGPERRPLFTIETGLPEPLEEIDPEPSDDPEKEERALRFEFDRDQVTRIAPEFGSEFIVDIAARKFSYLEVRATLELDGRAEAADTENEILDVLITETNPPPIQDAVFVIQRDGAALVDAEVELESPQGRPIKRTTDAAGIVRARGRRGDLFTLVSVVEKKQQLLVSKFAVDDPDAPSAVV